MIEVRVLSEEEVASLPLNDATDTLEAQQEELIRQLAEEAEQGHPAYAPND